LLKFALVMVLTWCVETAAAGPALRVNRPQVNVRADATVQAARIGVLRSGELVEKIGQKNEWNQIRLRDGQLGWLHADLVQELLFVERERVRVREAGSTAAATVALVERGAQLIKLREQGNWLEVEMADGRRGWIWKELVAARQIDHAEGEELAANSVQSVAVEAASADLDAVEPAVEDAELAEDPVRDESLVVEGEEDVLRNPYAEGLEREKDGDYNRALASFEEVLAGDPNHLRALLHAIKADKELGQYERGLGRLYRAVELSEGRRDVYMSLAEMYGLVGQADSVAKYEALFRGESWQPAAEFADEQAESDIETWWVYVAAVAASAFLLVIALVVLKKRSNKEKKPEVGGTKFARAMGQARPQNTSGGGEERELERQIREKRDALRESAVAFIGEGGGGKDADEDELMAGLLGQLDAFRRALEAQDERAKDYAELVRLQNAKIETMERELQLLKKRRRGA
jgi:SH3-like domain-containing protein